MDKIDQTLYEKYCQKYQADIDQLKQELNNSSIDSSNLEKAVNRGMEISEKLSWMWVKADYDNKQKLQNLIFPSGVMYDKQNDLVRTGSINSLFALIPLLERVLSNKKNGNLREDCLKISSVPETEKAA